MLRAIAFALLLAVLPPHALTAMAASPAVSDAPEPSIQAVPLVSPAHVGSAALLLEASDPGQSGAVPFSGTTTWSLASDEFGKPVIQARVDIPARNLTLDLRLRLNSDTSLPASHLFELDFHVPDSFIGGGIASVPGILLKNEELVTGTPLVGASARVVSNSFLFALTAATADVSANVALLGTRRFLDIALIYSSGKRALLTLERDVAALTEAARAIATWSAPAVSTPSPLARGPYVQLGSKRERAEAEADLRAFEQRVGAVLAGHTLEILAADLGPKGTFYRVIAPTQSFQEAVSLCADLKAAGIDCFPQN